jgi:glucose-1-phosphate cytidylyltransferase
MMKAVILCGGLGTRLSEETELRPKPMVEIGGRPILWHILKHYSHYGYRESILALGYKAEIIKRFFLEHYHVSSGFTVNLAKGRVTAHDQDRDNWTVHLVDTGHQTQTGGRLKRCQKWIGNKTFLMTYGDGVSNVNLKRLVAFHKSHKKLATVTAVRPPARFGGLVFDGDLVREFTEKPQIGEGWINGGFFVLEPEVLDYIAGDDIAFEREPLEQLANDRQLVAYRHDDFWQCMDTLRDARLLETLWQSGKAPWKVWNES